MHLIVTTTAKPRALPGEIPALVNRKWIQRNADLGVTSIIKLEQAGLLSPVEIPGIRGKRYRSTQVLPLLGLAGDSEAAE